VEIVCCDAGVSISLVHAEDATAGKVQSIDTLQSLTRKRQVSSDLSVKTGEKKAAPNIGEEPNRSLGHRKQGPLSSDAERRVHTKTHPTAHRDPVHKRHIRLRVRRDQVIELVFLSEKLYAFGGFAGFVLECELRYVPACTEGFFPGPLNDDNVCKLRFLPFLRVVVSRWCGREGRGETCRRGWILLIMEPFKALSLPGRFSSIVRTP